MSIKLPFNIQYIANKINELSIHYFATEGKFICEIYLSEAPFEHLKTFVEDIKYNDVCVFFTIGGNIIYQDNNKGFNSPKYIYKSTESCHSKWINPVFSPETR